MKNKAYNAESTYAISKKLNCLSKKTPAKGVKIQTERLINNRKFHLLNLNTFFFEIRNGSENKRG
jgi:hypothetical protein